MTNATGDDGPIGEVQEGMTVLDSAGDKVGTVRAVRMGDPQAATAQGQERAEGKGILGQLAAAFETDTLPDAAKERLARLGFLRVDATGCSVATATWPATRSPVSGTRPCTCR